MHNWFSWGITSTISDKRVIRCFMRRPQGGKESLSRLDHYRDCASLIHSQIFYMSFLEMTPANDLMGYGLLRRRWVCRRHLVELLIVTQYRRMMKWTLWHAVIVVHSREHDIIISWSFGWIVSLLHLCSQSNRRARTHSFAFKSDSVKQWERRSYSLYLSCVSYTLREYDFYNNEIDRRRIHCHVPTINTSIGQVGCLGKH